MCVIYMAPTRLLLKTQFNRGGVGVCQCALQRQSDAVCIAAVQPRRRRFQMCVMPCHAVFARVARRIHMYDVTHSHAGLIDMCNRPTQSTMYVPLQVNRSQKSILLIVQYKYFKSCSGDFNSQESDPPHKIMRYWIYYSTQLFFGFPPDRIFQMKMICIGGVPVSKRHFGGAGPSIFYMIHRGGRTKTDFLY